ncbi:MAG: hypothetical protein WKF30_00100 [Pyrinomonadaceae bacterium]
MRPAAASRLAWPAFGRRRGGGLRLDNWNWNYGDDEQQRAERADSTKTSTGMHENSLFLVFGW